MTGQRNGNPEPSVYVIVPQDPPQMTPSVATALLRVIRIIHRRRTGTDDRPKKD